MPLWPTWTMSFSSQAMGRRPASCPWGNSQPHPWSAALPCSTTGSRPLERAGLMPTVALATALPSPAQEGPWNEKALSPCLSGLL